jgi:peptidyl-prolyl cis-trans isomerase C
MRFQVVGGVQIPEALIAREAQNHPAGEGAQAWSEAANALAIRALLLHRAAALGLSAEPEFDDQGREETIEEALIRAVLDLEVTIQAPTAEECRKVYAAQNHRFMSPSLTEASHILVAPAGDRAEDIKAASELARGLIRDLALAPQRFPELAKAHSACPSAAAGGFLGQLTQGDLVTEVEQALARLEPGEVAAEPIRSRFGWHVLRLDRRAPGQTLPFERVEAEIRLNLEGRAWAAAATRYVADLAAEARQSGLLKVEDEAQAPRGATLGALMRAPGAAAGLEAWLEAGDPALLARARTAAAEAKLDLAAWILGQADAFVREADDDAWTRLISAAQGAEDPALAGLGAILKRALGAEPRRFTLMQRRP